MVRGKKDESDKEADSQMSQMSIEKSRLERRIAGSQVRRAMRSRRAGHVS